MHVITPERRTWFFRYQRHGKERMMGLGSAAVVSLDDARVAALAARQLLAKGIDPINQRQAERDAERKQEAARTIAISLWMRALKLPRISADRSISIQ